MAVSITITGEDEIDFRRQLMRIAVPYLEGFAETGGFNPEPAEVEPEPPAQAAATPEPVPAPAETGPKKQGRPKGSTNKPKTNGGDAAQTQPPPNSALVECLALAEQIQIITDAYQDQKDKFTPLLVDLRARGGFEYVSRALEKDRPLLQEFINEHGLAV